MKIVHMIQHLITGGAEKLVVDLALNQLNDGNDVYVICQYKLDSQYEKILESSDVSLIYVLKHKGLDLKNMHEITKTLKKINPDVVHTHMHIAIYALPFYIKNRNVVKIHTVHNIAEVEIEKHHRIPMRFAYKHLGVLPVSICHTVQKTMFEEYKIDKSPIIYNGVDTKRFMLPKQKHDGFVFISVASLTPRKNQMMLIKAFNLLNKEYNDIKLLLLGDGPTKSELMTEANGNENITFVGVTDKVPEYLSKSDVFVLSSFAEGLPLSILEAFAAGLVCLTTDVGGNHDIVKNNETGFLCQSDDYKQMYEKMKYLYENQDVVKRISEHNRKIAPNYDLLEMMKKYYELYNGK